MRAVCSLLPAADRPRVSELRVAYSLLIRARTHEQTAERYGLALSTVQEQWYGFLRHFDGQSTLEVRRDVQIAYGADAQAA